MATWYEALAAKIERHGGCRTIYRPGPEIGPDGKPIPILYLKRYYLYRFPYGEGMLHQFFLGDEGSVHDHPFPSCGMILATGYIEHIRRPWTGNNFPVEQIRRKAGDISWRPAANAKHDLASSFHKVELLPGTSGKVWTLFCTGRRVTGEAAKWGFANPEGFVPFSESFKKDGTEAMQSSPNQWGYGFFPKKKAV